MKPYYKTDKCTLYQCDNLELLKTLPNEFVDLIYCDVLYNTRKKFKDYDDNLGTSNDAVLWYQPRLSEIKRILKNTGSVYLQMDYRLVHYIKVKMDEIFGIKNFRNEIIWTYKSGGGSKRKYNEKKDSILFYTKSNNYVFNSVFQKRRIKHNYGFKQIRDTKGEDENGFYYLTHCSSVWDDIDINTKNHVNNETKLYDTQKPKKLLERIIKASSNPNNIVADFFMGSGTTGEVAVELGRRFIGCDIGDNACRITKERLEKIQ